MCVPISPITLAIVVLALAVSPATLLAQDPAEGEEPVAPPAETVEPAPAPPPADAGEPAPAESGPEPEPAPPPPGDPTEVAPPVPTSVPVARQSGSASVSMVDFAFSPSSIQVAVGGSVTWTNNGAEPHTATANDGSFDTGELGPGGSGSASFSQEGSFSYFCSIHPDMTGSVTVLAAHEGTTGDDGDTTDDGSAVPGPTEAEAVASPDAAGTEGGLPATGEEAGLLAAIGLVLLAFGLQLLAAQRLSPR